MLTIALLGLSFLLQDIWSRIAILQSSKLAMVVGYGYSLTSASHCSYYRLKWSAILLSALGWNHIQTIMSSSIILGPAQVQSTWIKQTRPECNPMANVLPQNAVQFLRYSCGSQRRFRLSHWIQSFLIMMVEDSRAEPGLDLLSTDIAPRLVSKVLLSIVKLIEIAGTLSNFCTSWPVVWFHSLTV